MTFFIYNFHFEHIRSLVAQINYSVLKVPDCMQPHYYHFLFPLQCLSICRCIYGHFFSISFYSSRHSFIHFRLIVRTNQVENSIFGNTLLGVFLPLISFIWLTIAFDFNILFLSVLSFDLLTCQWYGDTEHIWWIQSDDRGTLKNVSKNHRFIDSDEAILRICSYFLWRISVETTVWVLAKLIKTNQRCFDISSDNRIDSIC